MKQLIDDDEPFLLQARTVATKNSFHDAFKKRHGIVPADLFYEWPLYRKRRDTPVMGHCS